MTPNSSDLLSIGLSQLRSRWREHALRILLIVGLALIVAGVIFFFAYNWQALHRLAKLGLVELSFVACLLLAHVRWRHAYVADGLRVSAGALVGVLLAVFGQQYQTGADAYELFVAWGALILPLVILARVAALWVLWLAVVNTAGILWWEQVAGPEGLFGYDVLCLGLAGLDLLALLGRELGLRAGLLWLGGRWLRWLLGAALLATLLVPTTSAIVEGAFDEPALAVALVASVAAIAGGIFVYLKRLPDLAALAICVLASTYLVMVLVIKFVFDVLDGLDEGAFLLMGLASLGIFAGAAFVLRALHRQMVEDARQSVSSTEAERATSAAEASDASDAVGDASSEEDRDPALAEDPPAEGAGMSGTSGMSGTDEPWYIRTVLGLGGWLSALFFVGFLGLARVFEEPAIAGLLGAIFFGAAAGLTRIARGSFVGQAMIALGLVGNAGILIGVAGLESGVRVLPLLFWGQIVFCVVAYPLLLNDAFRFLIVLLVPILGCIWFWEMTSQLGLQALLAAEVLLVAGLWIPERLPRVLRALQVAALTILPMSILLFEIVQHEIRRLQWAPSWSVTLLMGVVLILFYLRLAGMRWMRNRDVWLAVVATAVLVTFSAQGLMVGLLLFVIAFARQDGYALVLALLFLPCFFVSYYYSLQVDLGYKSWIVAGTGLVILSSRPFLAMSREAQA
jgi:uncharacterized membrane protein